MDDPSSTEKNAQAAGGRLPLDPVTAELKVEFARLDKCELDAQEREAWFQVTSGRVRKSMEILEGLDTSRRGVQCMITCVMERAFAAIEALNNAVAAFGPSEIFSSHYRFWCAFIAYCLSVLAQLSSLRARSHRAFLSVPLFADGPELSGYKHRLR